MQAGFNRMNDVTVIQASQGLAMYVREHVSDALSKGIVVGHDHRHNSLRFAELTCLAFVYQGFTVYKLGMVHTPLVPFGIDQLNASCGVMITASHNPAEDNGYKVYWSNGCQIIPPHDEGISQSIEENLEPWTWDVEILNQSDKVKNPVEELEKVYFKQIKMKLMVGSLNPEPGFKVVYTPIHGVGLPYIKQTVEILGLTDSMIAVDQQAMPDPDFPTVKFPNPEEKGALDLAKTVADQHGATFIIANDPDADRFVAAVKDKQNSQWVQLTGNQIGDLFAEYLLKHSAEGVGKLAMLNSTVSSEFLSHFARKHGIHYEDTLTGFKWIGNRAIDLEEQGYVVPFAYEEALGYMFSVVHDKDGISAACVMLQMAVEWHNNGTDGLQQIQKLYKEIGYFADVNSYYITSDPSTTVETFENIRSLYNATPTRIGSFQIDYWRDLTIGYDSSTPDHKPVLPVSASTQIITVKLSQQNQDEGIRFTARGSGTEPKLKVYIEAHSSTPERALNLAQEVWELLELNWFKPDGIKLKRG